MTLGPPGEPRETRPSPDPDAARVTRERDLFRALLHLTETRDLRVLVESALAIAVDLTHADRGYLALYDPVRASPEPRWWTAHACDDRDLRRVRSTLSTGVMTAALASGAVVRSDSAASDVRFQANESVRRNGIAAVLCAPVGRGPFEGVVYLQGRHDGGPFDDDDVALLGLLASTAGVVAERLVAEVAKGPRAPDPTAVWRERLDLAGIVGRSEALARVFDDLGWIAPCPLDVLIRGPSGAGKSLFAQAIHRNSSRRSGPFLEINCGAIPETLFEGELFGTTRGAFTDAVTRPGIVERAEGGTLFLDEIGDLPATQQAKLLTFLESRSFTPVGGSRVVRSNVRVIAATNVDLEAAIRERRFREDLWFRLKVAELTLPSLAERREDISTLARHFVRVAGGTVPLSPGAELALEIASWPGDVRELHHRVQTAVHKAKGRGAAVIERKHLVTDRSAEPESRSATLQEATHGFRREHVRRSLLANRWNVSATARELDVSRAYLYTLMTGLGITPEREDPL